MGLIIVWAVTVGYFLLLWSATSLEVAVAASTLFVVFALKVTVKALLLPASVHQDHPPIPEPDQPQAANQNHPPG